MNPKLFAAIVGLCAFVIAFTLGSLVTATTGVPLAGGLLNGILVSMVLVIGMLASKHPWTGSMMWVAFSIPAVVTTTLGPPGFYKRLVALIAGFLWYIFYRRLFKDNRWLGLYGGAIIGGLTITALIILFLKLFVSGAIGFMFLGNDAQASLDRLLGYLWFLMVINVIVTVIGVALGELIYRRRLKDVIKVADK